MVDYTLDCNGDISRTDAPTRSAYGQQVTFANNAGEAVSLCVWNSTRTPHATGPFGGDISVASPPGTPAKIADGSAGDYLLQKEQPRHSFNSAAPSATLKISQFVVDSGALFAELSSTEDAPSVASTDTISIYSDSPTDLPLYAYYENPPGTWTEKFIFGATRPTLTKLSTTSPPFDNSVEKGVTYQLSTSSISPSHAGVRGYIKIKSTQSRKKKRRHRANVSPRRS